ncbi:hypothetical protein [uncultured Mucilaginibacter sp.]|uniref:hypothetical protein n=1 Tax=uncultured Mucilaginibacter sp. TaxID=797541 RepID=UPI0026255231|nr:hypothetical protein [uncultured Mucilaginibacter sp.]
MVQDNTSKDFTFKYVKPLSFKTAKIDGIIGGLNVKREISMNFYVDAIDLPSDVIHTVNENTTIGDPILENKKTQSALRELLSGVNFDIQTAKSIVVWLNDKIKEAEKQNAEIVELATKQSNKLIDS